MNNFGIFDIENEFSNCQLEAMRRVRLFQLYTQLLLFQLLPIM
jgi:hypothetical protein